MNQITHDNGESRDPAGRAIAGDSTTAEDASVERPMVRASVPVSAFAITTPASSVALDQTRQATVSFMATNTSGRALRGRAGVVVPTASTASTPAAQATWLTLDGAVDRDFPVGGAQQYSVRIAVPADAPPGQYTFRLDVTGVANPDEQYAQGPSVGFTVPAKPVAPPKPFPWWIVAILVVALLLVGGGVTAFLLLRDVAVPNVVGQSMPSAQATLQAANLALGTVTERPIANATPGILEQTPVAGVRLARGSAVNLVAARSITVPASPEFAGVMVSGVRMSAPTGVGTNVVTAAPNASVNVVLSYTIRDPGCASCIDQILIGFSDSTPGICAYNGIPGPAGNSGSYNFGIAAPSAPGIYYLGFDRSQQFGCAQALGHWWSGPPDANRYFAAVIVQ